MLLSAVSVLVVAQSSSEIPEGLTNNPVCMYVCMYARLRVVLSSQQPVSSVVTPSIVLTMLSVPRVLHYNLSSCTRYELLSFIVVESKSKVLEFN